MAIGDAQNFIHELMQNPALRDDFAKVSTQNEMDNFLSTHNYNFNSNDFENGFNNLLFNCQHESLANLYYQIKYIYDAITFDIQRNSI